MSEDFSSNLSAKFSDINAIDYYQQIEGISDSGEKLQNPYDHIYSSNNDGAVIETLKHKLTCQTAESEVRLLKEWLLLHLDLIQQQNEEILSKERTILILKQENEMLKERLSCMEQTIPVDNCKEFPINIVKETKFKEELITEDMTQGLGSYDIKNTIEFEVNCNDVDNNSIEFEVQKSDAGSEIGTQICENINKFSDCPLEYNEELNFDSGINGIVKTEGETIDNLNFSETFNFSSELSSVQNLRMSIRRKRVCSNSSVVSHNGSAAEDKKTFKRIRKRRKKSLKDNQILTTANFYVNQIGDPLPGISACKEQNLSQEVLTDTVLEVPRWRVKVYASCYTMEGTENLDDEVFLRRHNRLEIDERRRKRWDVQRIREQRVIEKLKQRQERIDSNLRTDMSNGMREPFWPSLDDIKFIEVCDELPVSAFGEPIPGFSPSEFTLPWLNSATSGRKDKLPIRRAIRRRKTRR